MIHALLLAALGAMPPCWDVFDAALRRSANAAHPPYVTYSERIVVSEDGTPLIRSTAHVEYRDDGLARVSDERFSYQPFITRRVEPGRRLVVVHCVRSGRRRRSARTPRTP